MVMREMVLHQVTNFEDKRNNRSVLERSRRRWLITFFFCAIAGGAMCIIGLMISVLGSFRFFEVGTFLDRVDTGLIAASFPIIVFAAHSLDKAEAVKKALKVISYKVQNK